MQTYLQPLRIYLDTCCLSRFFDDQTQERVFWETQAIRYIGKHPKAIGDYTAAVKLKPNYANAYYKRGVVWLHLKEWERAKVDLMTAKNKGADIVALFRNDYESVEDFEAKNEVKVPEGIAALLRGES